MSHCTCVKAINKRITNHNGWGVLCFIIRYSTMLFTMWSADRVGSMHESFIEIACVKSSHVCKPSTKSTALLKSDHVHRLLGKQKPTVSLLGKTHSFWCSYSLLLIRATYGKSRKKRSVYNSTNRSNCGCSLHQMIHEGLQRDVICENSLGSGCSDTAICTCGMGGWRVKLGQEKSCLWSTCVADNESW